MGHATAAPPQVALSPLAKRALDIDRQADGLVRFLAPVPMPAGPVLFDGRGATDWVVSHASIDPHVAASALSIPRGPRQHLERIAASGVRFDLLLIGHELPPGSVAALDPKVKAALVGAKTGAAGVSTSTALAALIGDPAPDPVAAKVVAGTQRVISAVTAGTSALGAGARGLLETGLDPAVFGVVSATGTAKPGELVALFYLTHWV